VWCIIHFLHEIIPHPYIIDTDWTDRPWLYHARQSCPLRASHRRELPYLEDLRESFSHQKKGVCGLIVGTIIQPTTGPNFRPIAFQEQCLELPSGRDDERWLFRSSSALSDVFGMFQHDIYNDRQCRGNDALFHLHTAIFLILRNYAMKDEIYCFVIFMIAIYERNYVVIGRNINIVQFLSFRTKHIIFIIIIWNERYWSGQTMPFVLNETFIFVWDERGSTISISRPIVI
jgi:hypothetical protein